jgi:hypothetical protein
MNIVRHGAVEGELIMKTMTCVLAVLAAVSTAAVAKDLKQDQKTTPAPTVKATVMSEADMDKVTAGSANYHRLRACNHPGRGQPWFCP